MFSGKKVLFEIWWSFVIHVTSMRIALWIRMIMSGQVAKLSWLTFCTFQLILMELRSKRL
ncbi:hypothetical protein WH47_03139 [Habropoda laboriosa]|uniref:Uncharacterized protein n=1 Tax=Habropoda laboriosa TaxID=597456 RepID=A0A0L7QY64_9HYME|nr:hypothetical protein WH47_03139 [Habropoda laboriosa]